MLSNHQFEPSVDPNSESFSKKHFFLYFSLYRRIIDEVSDVARVKFRYIVPIYGVCREVTGVVMEYMGNGSLNSLLASHTLMWPKKFQMIHEASMGMNFLHSMKPPVLHLNLKTSNILLDDHLHVKVRAVVLRGEICRVGWFFTFVTKCLSSRFQILV